MYAIVETGGKQYQVSVGQTVEVEKLAADVGEQIELDRVLMVVDGDQVKVGRPYVEGARVKATVMAHDRGRKIRIFKYRPRKRYRRRAGHRQWFTRLKVEEIVAG